MSVREHTTLEKLLKPEEAMEILVPYLDEQSYRFNERKFTDSERFAKVLGAIADKRLTYEHLTGKDLAQESLPTPLPA